MSASTTYGTDLNFSETSLISMHNAELADTLGNLVHRGLNLCQKFCDGKIPDVEHDSAFELPFSLDSLRDGLAEEMKMCNISIALFRTMEAVRGTNKYEFQIYIYYIYQNISILECMYLSGSSRKRSPGR